MEETRYLLYAHYKIKKNSSGPEMIQKAARVSFLDFCRRMPFQKNVVMQGRNTLDREAKEFLSTAIPELLRSVECFDGPQKEFDYRHEEICRGIIRIYSGAGKVPYGIAQRWLNLTLMNLVVIEVNMKTGYWPIRSTRKYFHVPVDQYLLEAAARKNFDRYQTALGLKCAPFWHDDPDHYTMGWFVPGKTQPYEYWEYQEYMAFQLAVRECLSEYIEQQIYQDPLDWAFKAFLEVAQEHNR